MVSDPGVVHVVGLGMDVVSQVVGNVTGSHSMSKNSLSLSSFCSFILSLLIYLIQL